ncbi:MAG: hypothetical protein J6Z32_01760 [Bacteroidales bacterium]|nr:hypothetical protein [Bacteroidales bacterium]
MMEIYLSSENYKEFLPVKVVAFTYAEFGAMGDPGRVELIDVQGRVFLFYLQEDKLKISEVEEFFPEFKSLLYFPKKAFFCTRNGYLESFYEGWSEFDLGMGNHLIFSGVIKKELTEKLLNLESYNRFCIAEKTVLKAVEGMFVRPKL